MPYFKSSRCAGTGNTDGDCGCVNVLFTTRGFVVVTDEDGRSSRFDMTEWNDFIHGVKAGEFDGPAATETGLLSTSA